MARQKPGPTRNRWLIPALVAIGVLLGLAAALNLEQLFPMANNWEEGPPNR